ncbi:MAG: RNA methyltransferase [Bacteroidia bacterium]|nr:RNA methyltransferase [Bacteroidia bacterium]MCZ2277247.1 RNA methyltransferase [Bacteroidia bacterium]
MAALKNIRKLKSIQLNRLSAEQAKAASSKPVVMVLDNIRSALNVGSVFRTADAFRVDAIYLCGITAQPPHREILKTALGATETVRWKYFRDVTDAIEDLRSRGFHIAVIEQTNRSILLGSFTMREQVALVLGNEIEGVSESILPLCDTAIEIPQHGMKHSLNVAVCAGIVLWEIFR